MDLIAIKNKGVGLPAAKNIENCIKYNKTFSVAFARDGIITVVRELKSEDYETLINYYELNENDSIMFCFQGYSANPLGDMPIVISNSHKKGKSKTFTTNKSVIAFADSVLGVKEDEESKQAFISNIAKFDRSKFSDIANLVFGDNLVAILNTNGEFETYGLELTSTKKWKESQSGVIYTDDDYNSKTTNYNYNYNYYQGCYNDYYYDYEYNDQNPKPYKCDVCKENATFIISSKGKMLCDKCYNKEKLELTNDKH